MTTIRKHRHLLITLLAFLCLSCTYCPKTNAEDKNSAASVPGPITEVKVLMGRPAFFCDGQPFTEPLFTTYVEDQKSYDQTAKIAGIKLFNFVTTCGEMVYGQHAKPTWIAQDKWDFSEMDERAHMILKANPDALIIPRIYIGAPKWWRDENPDEMMVLHHGGKYYEGKGGDDVPGGYYSLVLPRRGTYESIASEKWRKDMVYALKKTIEHMQNSDWGKNIFGYQISAMATEEWYHLGVNQEQMSDYSKPMQEAFRKWLKNKYADDDAIKKAWNNPNVTLQTASIPTDVERKRDNTTFHDVKTEMNVIDFYRFWNEIIPQTLDYFAAAAKQATGHKKVIGAFYGYFFEFGGSTELAHNATHDILLSKNIDFIMAPPSYCQRQVGTGAELHRRPTLSGTLNGKLWFHDNDLASFLFPKVMKKVQETGRDPFITDETIPMTARDLAVQPTAQQTIWQFQRAAGYVACEGITESFFDLHGGYYDDSRLLSALGQIGKMMKQSQYYDKTSISEVLIVADSISPYYMTSQMKGDRLNNSLRFFQLGFFKSGAPFDCVFIEDLQLVNLSQYKMIMFLNNYHMTNEQREFIDKNLKKDGKFLVWCYAPGLFNGTEVSASAMEKLTGIKIVPSADETFIEPKSILADSVKDWMSNHGEKPYTEPVGQDGKICKLFYVQDSNADTLATLAGTQTVTMAKKDMNGWTSIYMLSSVMPPSVIRSLEKFAGVHIFASGDDSIQVNKSYISINGGSAGNKTISLPYPCDVYNALTEEKWYDNVTTFDTSLMFGETQIFRYAPVGKN